MKQVIVIGAGPAGLTAAIKAAENGAQVTVLEHMEKAGRKLLLTGNGKCNLSSCDPDITEKYSSLESGQTAFFVKSVFAQFSVADTIAFFEEIGLLTTELRGGIYPRTMQSSSVLELLLQEAAERKIKIKYRQQILSVEKRKDRMAVCTEGWDYVCDSVIVAAGSRALARTGSDGSGYLLAEQTGHRITEIYPALTALYAKNADLSGCAGVRARAAVRLYEQTEGGASAPKLLAEDIGEVQFTREGISGIVVFQVSRYVSCLLNRNRELFVMLDLLPEMEENEIADRLQRQCILHPKRPVRSLFTGLLPDKLADLFLKRNHMKHTYICENLSEADQHSLAAAVKHFQIPVNGVRDFDQCQVCCGGVDLMQINPETLESRILPGLYFAGEILDVDGPCGGYNLQWAWSSGAAAGIHAADLKGKTLC